MIVPAGGGRTIFVLPWLGRTLIGTTDNDYEGALEHVPASDDDIAYLLEAVNGFFGTSLGPDDLTGAYAGVRPLISTGDPKKSVDISRKAELYETSSGLVTITGGKLTTWRRMAKTAVDRIVEREGREAPCRTHEIPLGLPEDPADAARGARRGRGQPRAPGGPLRARRARRAAPGGRGAAARGAHQPELPDLVAEAAFAVGHEQARSLADVLLRRTRLGLLDARSLLGAGLRGRPARRAGDGRRARLGRGAHRAGAARLGARSPRREGLVPGGGRGRGRMTLVDGHRQRDARLVLRPRRARSRSTTLVERAHELAEQGAAIVDVGGESGRTDRPAVPVEEERARVVPLIERLAADGLSVSVDTWRAPVARAALEAGAAMINDVSGLSDPELADACAEAGAALVVTHTRAGPKVKAFPDYDDVVADVIELLRERAALAVERGVADERLVFDPGIDLAKTPAESIELLRRLPELAELGARCCWRSRARTSSAR